MTYVDVSDNRLVLSTISVVNQCEMSTTTTTKLDNGLGILGTGKQDVTPYEITVTTGVPHLARLN